MEKQYINIWYETYDDDNKIVFMHEQNPVICERDAIDAYYQELSVSGRYSHTIVLDYETKTFTTIDLEKIIDKQMDEIWQQDQEIEDQKYGSYEDQVKSLYNSTRL